MENEAAIPETSVGALRRRHNKCLVVAHRGFSSAYPENTIEAYEQAIAAGADLVEIDLRLSRDGVLVCQHDATIGDAEVAGMTADELAARQVTHLTDVLPVLKGRTGILFDLKLADPSLTDAAMAELDRLSMRRQAILGVRSIEQAYRVRASSDDIVVLGLLKPNESFARFYEAGGDIARLWEDECTTDRIAAVRCGDHPVWVTAGRRSLNDEPGDIDSGRLMSVLQHGVDGVLANDTALACRVRAAAAHRLESVSP